AGTTETEDVITALESGDIYFDGPGGRVWVRGEDHHTTRSVSCFRINFSHQAEEIFRTEAIHCDYIETMIQEKPAFPGD
ncbi:MAG: ABC transporter substrate-binding protein, partial [Eubacterium aggregans]